MSSKAKAVVIVAPSGAGKGTLITRLMDEVEGLVFSVSSTTRSPREGEVNGVHYNFISVGEFEDQIKQDSFVEWAKVHENYYGTSKKVIQDNIEKGTFVILDIDVQGADNVKSTFGDDAYAIFISPPSLELLEERLRGRGTEDDDTVNVRMTNARSEMLRKDDYDYLLVNDDLERSYDEFKTVIKALMAEK